MFFYNHYTLYLHRQFFIVPEMTLNYSCHIYGPIFKLPVLHIAAMSQVHNIKAEWQLFLFISEENLGIHADDLFQCIE